MRRRDLLKFCGAMPAAIVASTVKGQSASETITRAAVIVGVDQSEGLPKLHAATSGANMVANWLEQEKPPFKVTRLTDDVHPVRAADIFKAVDAFVALGTVRQLVIYFAGHGSVVGYGEFWLLSDAPHNPNEAVCFPETFDLARYCNIPNIVFISDACRSTSESLNAQHMRGQLIFPNLGDDVRVSTQVDKFLATAIGSAAYEAKGTTANYNGIFTSCFLDAYKDPYSDLVEQVDGVLVITNRKMTKYLPKIVPARAMAASSKIDQVPYSSVEADPNVYIGAAAKTPLPTRRLDTVAAIPTINHVVTAEFKNFGFAIGNATTHVRTEELNKIATDTGFDHDRGLVLGASGPNVFKQATGLNVLGARVRMVSTSLTMKAQFLRRSDNQAEPTVISIDPGQDRQGSVVIEFENGSGTIVAALRAFVANIVVDGGNVANVSYVPGEFGEQLKNNSSNYAELDQLHALVAASARRGVFQIDGPEEVRTANGQRLGDALRAGKLFDPTLGMYAAYAYADAGLQEQIRSVYGIMKSYGLELFDIAMLAGALAGRSLRDFPAPFCPMLSQGWGLLRARKVDLPEGLLNARDHLFRALWTTFDSEGMRIVRTQLDNLPIKLQSFQ